MARVPLVSADAVPPEYRDHLDEDVRLNIWAAVGNNASALEAYDGFIERLYEVCGLSDIERELVILAVAAELSSRYVWHQHVKIAREVGISDAKIMGIAHFDADPFTDGEQALVRYARAVARGQVRRGDHDGMARVYDVSTIVGTAVLAGTYLSIARIIAALDVELEADEEFVGWDPS